jgi:hypothetical protein
MRFCVSKVGDFKYSIQGLIEIAGAFPDEPSRGSLGGIDRVLPQRIVDVGGGALFSLSLFSEKVNLIGLKVEGGRGRFQTWRLCSGNS